MTTTITLSAERREGTGKGPARRLRMEGKVPAVLYGKDMETIHLTVDAREALHLFQSISVENTIIELRVSGDKAPHQALVRDIQTHPYKPDLVHIDFLRIQKGVAVDLEVPIRLEGVPVGVKLHGGTVEQNVHELAIRCIPSRIPDEIVVDVSGMDVGDSVHVSELDPGEGVEILVSGDLTVCSVAAPRAAAVVEEAEEGEGLEEEEAAAGEAQAGSEESEG